MLRAFRAKALGALRERGVDLCQSGKAEQAAIAKVFDQLGHPHDGGQFAYELCIPDRVPAAAVKGLGMLDDEIARWEERLATVGDDAQLANVDLQNVLQKQQQALQMLSNISKSIHDSMAAVIRNLGG